MKLVKLAIITPGFKPVPAVKGGAVEHLIQNFIEANESEPQYNIDLYTIDDPALNGISYKYTNLIRIPSLPPLGIRFGYRIYSKVRKEISVFNRNYRIFNYYSDRVRHLFKRKYYDAVLVENIMDNYFSILDKITNEKLYFHLHNELENNKNSMITGAKAIKILETVDKFIVVSEFLKNQVKALNNLYEEKIIVVHNGIIKKNLNRLSKDNALALRSKYGIKKKDIVFTYIGTLSKAKGFDKFIEAAKRLKDNNQIEFLVSGDITDINTNKMTTYTKNLIFTGYINNKDIAKIYSISDCIVIPTQIEETFGVVALEAITMGVPVIASVSGGLPEVLSKKCAIFVPKTRNYVTNLCNAIIKVSENSNLRKSMKECGIQQSRLFPQSQKEYFDLLNKVLKDI